MSLRQAALALGVALLAAGCAAALRHPTPGDAARASQRWPGTTVADLERGRAVYVRRCSSCHTLVLPDAYPAGDWPALVEAMTEKARLTPAQATDTVRFLTIVAEPTGGSPKR
jgi:mono/diheme cytochrome c family protein